MGCSPSGLRQLSLNERTSWPCARPWSLLCQRQAGLQAMACVLDLGAGGILLWAAVAWLLRSTLERRSWLPRSFSVGTVAGGSNGRNLLLTVLELGSPSPRCLRGWSLVSPMFWPAGGHFVTIFTGWLESGLETLPRRVWDQVPALTSPFDLTRLCKGLSSSHVGVGQGLTVETG